jgi:hypothetical protein
VRGKVEVEFADLGERSLKKAHASGRRPGRWRNRRSGLFAASPAGG